MEPKFKVGDKVKIINNCSYCFVNEKDGALGMIGVIFRVPYCDIPCGVSYCIESDEFTSVHKRWDFYEVDLELVNENATSVSASIISNICPRCGNEMGKKLTQEYGLIDKCQNCGYC